MGAGFCLSPEDFPLQQAPLTAHPKALHVGFPSMADRVGTRTTVTRKSSKPS